MSSASGGVGREGADVGYRDFLTLPAPGGSMSASTSASRSPIRSRRLPRTAQSFEPSARLPRANERGVRSARHRPSVGGPSRFSPSGRATAAAAAAAQAGSTTSDVLPARSMSHSPSQSKIKPPQIRSSVSGLPAFPNDIHRVPALPTRRRARANSLHFPASPDSPTHPHPKDYLLPHYSTDRAYSLAPTKRQQQQQQQLSFELGLGDDFDQSFGEAMRNGVGGEEMPLPQEALRVLSQAKENMDLRLIGKKGRKGSLGMGLFKESRDKAISPSCVLPADAVGFKAGKLANQIREQAVMEEDENSVSSSASASTADEVVNVPPLQQGRPSPSPSPSPLVHSTPHRPPSSILLPAGTHQDPGDIIHDNDLSNQTAAIQIVSSPLLRASPHSPNRPSAAPDSGHSLSYDESGWTTTGSDESSTESSDASGDEAAKGDRPHPHPQTHAGSGSEEEADDDEGESMTVPLQPFDHAVGGHSSIYKFTRRAVCKVSRYLYMSLYCLTEAACLPNIIAARQSGKLILRRSRAPRASSARVHTPLPRCHACELPSGSPCDTCDCGCRYWQPDRPAHSARIVAVPFRSAYARLLPPFCPCCTRSFALVHRRPGLRDSRSLARLQPPRRARLVSIGSFSSGQGSSSPPQWWADQRGRCAWTVPSDTPPVLGSITRVLRSCWSTRQPITLQLLGSQLDIIRFSLPPALPTVISWWHRRATIYQRGRTAHTCPVPCQLTLPPRLWLFAPTRATAPHGLVAPPPLSPIAPRRPFSRLRERARFGYRLPAPRFRFRRDRLDCGQHQIEGSRLRHHPQAAQEEGSAHASSPSPSPPFGK